MNDKYVHSYMDLFKLLHRFIPPYRGRVALNLLFNFLATILTLGSFTAIIPILRMLFGISDATVVYTPMSASMSLQDALIALKGNAYYYLQEQITIHGASNILMLLGVFLIIMTGLKCGASYFAAFFMAPIRTGVLRDIRRQMYSKVISLPIGYFTEERKGDVMSRMTSDVSEVENSVIASLEVIFKDPIMIIIYLATLFFISWELTLFVLVLLPVAGGLIGRIGRNLKRSSSLGQEQNADILTQIEESLGGLRIVKAFNAEDKLRTRFERQINATRRTFNGVHRRYALAHPMSEFLGTCLIAILLWYGGGLIISGNSLIDAATFIYYLVIFYSIIGPAKDLSKASYSIRKGVASLERIDKILNAKSNIVERPDPLTLNEFNNSIKYDNVSFHYQSDRPVLKNISVEIKKGQMVALVGQSGSGKTTMADLIPRFYDVTGGSITIDGVNVKDLRTCDLRALMGNVNQEAILFNDTFYNNITFGVDTTQPAPNGGTWQQAVEAAARIANAHDFIMDTPDGYETSIGDRGSRLSGGQRQRISIARAILKNPPILILDEATSALDTESEKLVQDALENLMRDRTTIVVAHRLSTIRNADLICVLHEGEIVERGRHEDLIKLGGYYKKLVDMQNSK